MRKLGIFLAVIVLLTGVSVHAQKKPRITPKVNERTQIVIQDDAGRGSLIVDLISGEYKVSLCESGHQVSGSGEVKIDGCSVYFSTIQTGYRIFATVNMCDHSAISAVEMFEVAPENFQIEPILEYWTDKDMNDSIIECGIADKN